MEYPLCVPPSNSGSWKSHVLSDDAYKEYRWIVPACQSLPKDLGIKKVAITNDLLRTCSGFICRGDETNFIWVCVYADGKLQEMSLERAVSFFSSYKNLALLSGNSIKLYDFKLPLVPSSYYKKISESAKWNEFLSPNLVHNVQLKQQIPTKDYINSRPAFISFTSLATMSKKPNEQQSQMDILDVQIDIEKLSKQNFNPPFDHPLATMLAEATREVTIKNQQKKQQSTTEQSKQSTETPKETPVQGNTADVGAPTTETPAAPEKKKRKPPQKKNQANGTNGSGGGKKTKTSVNADPPSPSSIVLDPSLLNNNHSSPDVSNKENLMFWLKKIVDDPRFHQKKKNPFSDLPDKVGTPADSKETQKALMLFAQGASFYFSRELNLSVPSMDKELDDMFNLL